MNTEKYIVRLSDKERHDLEKIVKKLKGTSQKLKWAIVLLKADWAEEIERLVMHDFADAKKVTIILDNLKF